MSEVSVSGLAIRQIAEDSLPWSIEQEENLLAAMMASPFACATALSRVDEDDFYRDSERVIFKVIHWLSMKGRSVDSVTVVAELKRIHKITLAGGAPHVYTLNDLGGVAANVREYADIVHELGVRRRLILAGLHIIDHAQSDQELTDVINASEAEVFKVGGIRDSESSAVPLRDLLNQAYEDILRIQEGGASGVPTGFRGFDKVMGGMQEQNLIILAARPGVGKTSLALNIASNVATAGTAVAFFSLEMSGGELATRLACSVAKVNSQKIKLGELNSAEHAAIVAAMGSKENLPLDIDQQAGLTVIQLRQKVRRMMAKHSYGLIVVDYLQLFYMGDRKSENRQNEVARISGAMKQLAREFEVPVLCLSQLSRGAEARENKEPRLSDLRDSGAIEQDADVVIFLHPGEDTPDRRGTMGVHIAKHRNGPTAYFRLAWSPDYCRFRDMAESAPIQAQLPAGGYHAALEYSQPPEPPEEPWGQEELA
jgi:replicative DNA helicase